MALGTKDFLSLSDEHDSDRSLPLNMLFCLLTVLCSGWWTLSKIVSNLLRVILSAIVVRQSSSVPTTAPAFLTSLSSRPASLFLMLVVFVPKSCLFDFFLLRFFKSYREIDTVQCKNPLLVTEKYI